MALPRNPKILKSTQSYEEQEQREIDQMKEHVDSLQTRSGSRRGNTKGKRNAAGQGKTTVQEPSDPDEDDIDHLMRLFMSGKKQHEVVRMGVITKSLTDQTQVKTVLGMGSLQLSFIPDTYRIVFGSQTSGVERVTFQGSCRGIIR